MDISRAFVSSFAELDSGFRKDHMKLCFLWHDEVMIDAVNEYRRQNYISQIVDEDDLSKKEIKLLTDVIVPLQDSVSQDLIDSHQQTRKHGYPRWGENYENYTYPEPQDAEEYAHNMLLAHIEREKGIKKFKGLDVEYAEGRARVAIDAVSFWGLIQHEVQCIMEASFEEKLAMTAANKFHSNSKQILEPHKLFETSVPSLFSVPWTEIISLKCRGHFDKLRDKMAKIASFPGRDLSSAQEKLKALEVQATEEIIEKYRPNVRKVALESVAANIPLTPIVNPISVIFGARDTIKEKKKFDELTWLYLLRDVRNLVND